MTAEKQVPTNQFRLPIEAGDKPPYHPRPEGTRVLITGAAGVVAGALVTGLGESHQLIGMDRCPVPHSGFSRIIMADANNREALSQAASEAEYIVHLTSGVKGGWEALVETEVEGTKNLLEAAVENQVRRVVIASSTHSVGWNERLLVAGEDVPPVTGESPIRPDGLYGAAKAFVESLARFTSEWTGLPVSILRLGTMRLGMSLEELIASDELPYLGRGEFRRSRLQRSWLTAEDLTRYVLEEFSAPEPYRLRFATSSPEQEEWDHSVYTG